MNVLLTNANFQGVSRIPTTSKMELLVTLVNDFSRYLSFRTCYLSYHICQLLASVIRNSFDFLVRFDTTLEKVYKQ